MVIFKLLVRKYRRRKKLTQKQLAELSGVSKSYIGDIECGRKIPRLETLERISKALRVNMGDLIKDDMDFSETESTPK